MRTRGRACRGRWGLLLSLLALVAALPGPVRAPGAGAQALADQATLEAQRPEVQWSVAGATEWVPVPARQEVRAGDRVRTGPTGRARLVYFEGSVTEVGPGTGILVQRLEPSPEGSLATRLFQAVGTTLSRVRQLVDPAASFELETPAATAFVRGTIPHVQVGPDGTTRVANLPEPAEEGLVFVQGKDPAQTEVRLPPGWETIVVPGLAPTMPQPLQASTDLEATELGTSPELHAVERERRRAAAQAAVAQAQAGLAAIQAELNRLAQQEQALRQQVLALLTATPTPTPGRNDVPRIAAGLTPDGNGPCATQRGQVCPVIGPLSGSTGTVIGSMEWRIVVPAGLLPAGAIATVFLPTTQSIEFFDCPPATAGIPTVCRGITGGNGRLGGTVRVFVSNQQVLTGTIVGPGVVLATSTPIPTPIATSTATATATSTPPPTATSTPTPTATATPTATPTPTPTATATPTATPTPTPTPTPFSP